MMGPGRYDQETTTLREAAKARGVVVIIFEGDRGSGFSVQAPLDIQFALPGVLRHVADGIECQLFQVNLQNAKEGGGQSTSTSEATDGNR